MLHHLVEHFCGFKFAAKFGWDRSHNRLKHATHPFGGGTRFGKIGSVLRAVAVEIVQQHSGLVFFGIETGELQKSALMMARIDHLGLDANRRTRRSGTHRHFVDVETELVQPADTFIDPPGLVFGKLFGRGEFMPQPSIRFGDAVGNIDYAEAHEGYQGNTGGFSVSAETKRLIEQEVKRLIDEGYQTALSILTEKREDWERLAKGLLEYETLTGDEIKKVIAGESLDSDDDAGKPSSGGGSILAIPKTKPKAAKPGSEPEPAV